MKISASQYAKLLRRYIMHSNEKSVVVKQTLNKLRNLPIPSKIIDVGCGDGFISHAIAQLGHIVTAIDLRSSFKSYANETKPVFFIQDDIFKFKTQEKFDLIIAAYLFWEIPFERWQALMDIFFKLLNENGKIFILDTVNCTSYDNMYVDFNIFPDKKKSRELNNYWYKFLDVNKYKYNKNLFKTEIAAKNSKEMYEVLKFFSQGDLNYIYKAQKNRFLQSFDKRRTNKGIVIPLYHSIDVINPMSYH